MGSEITPYEMKSLACPFLALSPWEIYHTSEFLCIVWEYYQGYLIGLLWGLNTQFMWTLAHCKHVIIVPCYVFSCIKLIRFPLVRQRVRHQEAWF